MLNTLIFGARLWIWLLLLFGIIFMISVLLWVFKEWTRKIYLRLRHPQKTVKIVVHYSNNWFKEFYRLIPRYDRFTIEGLDYLYNEKVVSKNENTFLVGEGDDLCANISGDKYTILAKSLLKKRFNRMPSIHYIYGQPMPIDFADMHIKNRKFSSAIINDIKENDLFAKLLFLKDEMNFLIMILIITLISGALTVVILLKVFGVFDGEGEVVK